MKKMFSCMLLLLISMTLLLPAYAAFDNPPIIDDAGYLMQSELDELSRELDKVREKYNFEVAIYTESDMTSDTAEASADDIYDYNGYGAGENDDGILLYICRDTREYHFTTHGKGLEYFNKNGLVYLESKVLPYLEDDNYYKAFEVYIKTADELLKMASEGKPYNEKQYEEIKTYILNKYHFKVSSLYIAQIKTKYGIKEAINYNRVFPRFCVNSKMII